MWRNIIIRITRLTLISVYSLYVIKNAYTHKLVNIHRYKRTNIQVTINLYNKDNNPCAIQERKRGEKRERESSRVSSQLIRRDMKVSKLLLESVVVSEMNRRMFLVLLIIRWRWRKSVAAALRRCWC